MRYSKIKGLVAAPFTPMNADNTLNLDIIPQYADFLHKTKVKGVFVGGTTGEGISLTQEEQITLMHAWIKAAKGRLVTIFMAGSTSLEACKILAKEAASCGYDAIAYLPPYYFKPNSVQILADCCAEVAAAAPDLPFYYYHIPVLSSVHLPMLPLLKIVHEQIPNFVGIKYSDANLMDCAQCLHFADGKYDIRWGRDEELLAAMAMGVRGAVGSTYNYAAPVYHQVISAFQKGNMETALKYQHQSIEIVRLLGKYGGIRVGKAFMKAVGIDCGHFRLPITRMSDDMYQDFLNELEQIGFYEWIKPIYQNA
jgi:N-acetylneuraminate lyase